MTITRRQFIAAAGALGAGAALAQPTTPLPFLITTQSDPLLPKATGKRVVVCGGGWGGITAAKHLKQNDPTLDVVVLERNPVFFSCPMSNKWLIDVVDTNYLTWSYLKVADKYGYKFIQTEVTAFERDKKRVITAQGWVDYDYLIIGSGIRYNYEAWFGNDRRAADYTRTHFPAAYIPNSEHFILKEGIRNFKGGDLVMTLPPPPHRCPPSPYERACLIAWLFKTNKVKGRITILDPKDSPRPITGGFQEAFEHLYKDQITYVPKAAIQEVDPFNKRIKTSAGDFKFDHSILMAPHQAGDMAWKAGAVGKNAEGKPTGWANVDPVFLNLKDDKDVYVIGDSVGVVSPLFNFYPKAGHVANAHGKIVARYIADRVAGKEPKAALPDNLCFMMVNASPREDVAVRFKYWFNDKGVIVQDQDDDNLRRAEVVTEDFMWASRMYEDMFS
ncbi:MAG TPA: FAD-dependent oxidoreductase [Rhodocyclaceae bacterium]|nr:FAD-dependent oxidoreductase [Rhodocyclaceae bacterium]